MAPFRTVLNRFYLLLGKLLYDFRVLGAENLPKEGPFVFSAHHTSPLDFFAAAFIQRQRPDLNIMVLDAGFEHPLAAWYSRKFNSLPIHKSPTGLNRETLFAALKILQQGKPLLIAAEGEMSWDGKPQAYKSGAAWLILHARVPFVPGAFSRAYLSWPRWQTFPKLRGKLRLAIGKPVLPLDPLPDKINSRLLAEANRKMREKTNQTIDFLQSNEKS